MLNNHIKNNSNSSLSEEFENIYSQNYVCPVELVISSDRFVVHPYFQRNYVWTKKKASYLIETLLMGIPIPPIYTYVDKKNGFESVIDGQQRLSSIKKFMCNEYCFESVSEFSFFDKLYFKDLPQNIKQKLLNYPLSIISLHNVNNKKAIFDVFRRYNTGGVVLNPQEIRNCIYSGPFNDLIRELSGHRDFIDLFKDKEIDRMEKEQYVLRFLALYENLDDYNGNMNEFLDRYMDSKMEFYEKYPHEAEKNKNELRDMFLNVIYLCKYVFGDDAFKNCLDLQTSKGKKTVMYKLFSKPVFDMQMLGFTGEKLSKIRRYAGEIKAKYEEVLKNDENIRPYYKKMSRKALLYRITKWREHISNIVV